jgi:hypothetical protein
LRSEPPSQSRQRLHGHDWQQGRRYHGGEEEALYGALQGRCSEAMGQEGEEVVRELALVLILVIALCFGLAHMQRDQKPPPAQDTHTGILKGTVHDRPGCDDSDRPNLPCDGVRSR